jgi:hypothetical protein
VEVTGQRVLPVGDGGRATPRDVGHRGDQTVDVIVGRGQPGADPDSARHVTAIAVADGVPGAEAAVADADAVLGAEPGGDERVRDAGEREVASGRAGTAGPGPRTTTPGIAASPARSRR